MTNWTPWAIGGGVLLAGVAALASSAGHGSAAPPSPGSALQPHPLPANWRSDPALYARTLAVMGDQLRALGYACGDASSCNDAALEYAREHMPGMLNPTPDDAAAIIESIDDAYRADRGVPRSSGRLSGSGSLALRRARWLHLLG